MMNGQISSPHATWQLDWSVSCKSKQSGQACGDGYLICEGDHAVMFAVADGSGSGEDAADATRICLTTLSNDGVFELNRDFQRCHLALKDSRGAALAIVLIGIEDRTLSWAAVGDIDGILVRSAAHFASEAMVQTGGTMGLSFNHIHPQAHPMQNGDLIVLTSDGIKRGYRKHINPTATADQTSADIMRDFAVSNDDSIVLAISMGPKK